MDESNHMGPLIDKNAVTDYLNALDALTRQGGKILFGGEVLDGDGFESGCYVTPVIAEAENHYPIVQEETFAPILYLIKYAGKVDNAVKINNEVMQGLSSSIFTDNLKEAEFFSFPPGFGLRHCQC